MLDQLWVRAGTVKFHEGRTRLGNLVRYRKLLYFKYTEASLNISVNYIDG